MEQKYNWRVHFSKNLLLYLGPDNPSNPMMHPMARPQMGPGPMMQPMGPGAPSGGMRMMNPGMMPQQRMMGVPPQQQQQQQHGFMGWWILLLLFRQKTRENAGIFKNSISQIFVINIFKDY